MKITQYSVIGFGLVMCLITSVAQAGIQAEIDRALLKAAKGKTSLTTQEILFERRCEMIEKYLGYSDTAISRAMEYSCQGTQIGIALHVGADMGNYPPKQIRKVFIERVEKEGLIANVFIEEEREHGSNIVFFINGESYLPDRLRPVDALNKVPTITGNAKMIYIVTGQIHPDKLQPLSTEEKKRLDDWVKKKVSRTQP